MAFESNILLTLRSLAISRRLSAKNVQNVLLSEKSKTYQTAGVIMACRSVAKFANSAEAGMLVGNAQTGEVTIKWSLKKQNPCYPKIQPVKPGGCASPQIRQVYLYARQQRGRYDFAFLRIQQSLVASRTGLQIVGQALHFNLEQPDFGDAVPRIDGNLHVSIVVGRRVRNFDEQQYMLARGEV